MSDINLNKILFDQQYSNNSWQDLFDITSTLIFENENLQISSSNTNNTYSWQTFKDYKTIPKSYGFNDEYTGYCRLDRDGHWLLLSPPSLLHKDKKSLSNDSISQETEPTFSDACERLTISLDFHIPTDELITDINEQNMVVWRNQIPQSSDETLR
jgi:hypothetical protein